jgi:hypothetical protein
MKRKPEHYPVWLRKLLFDPMVRLQERYTNDPERNWDTLQKILHSSYRTDPKDALIFDLTVEMERNEIKHEEWNEVVAKELLTQADQIETLKNEIRTIKRILTTLE